MWYSVHTVREGVGSLGSHSQSAYMTKIYELVQTCLPRQQFTPIWWLCGRKARPVSRTHNLRIIGNKSAMLMGLFLNHPWNSLQFHRSRPVETDSASSSGSIRCDD